MIDKLERLVRNGKFKEVHSHLETLIISKIPRNETLPLANIARRSGFHRLAFKILNPVIRPKNRLKNSQATAEEFCEYAIILLRLGVTNEARKILASPRARDSVQHLFYLAFISFSEWDYEQASRLLESYIKSPTLDEYNLLLGKVNLVQAYVALGLLDEASFLIHEVIAKSKQERFNLILANALQNLADIQAERKDFDRAYNTINELKSIIGDFHYRYNLYIKRVIALSKLPDLTLIRELATEASAKRETELARECALIEAISSRNEEFFRRVYFGTPYPCYRQRMLSLWGQPIDLGMTYLWGFKSTPRSGSIFNVEQGRIEGTKITLKRGTTVHRLFGIFASNLYRTYKTESLFSLLFPNEVLQPEISIPKVYDTIARARKWLAGNKIGITIEENHGEYYITSHAGWQVRVSLTPSASEDVMNENIKQLKTHFLGKEFKVKDVMEVLGLSKPSANRVLIYGVNKGAIQRIGNARATTYKIVLAATKMSA